MWYSYGSGKGRLELRWALQGRVARVVYRSSRGQDEAGLGVQLAGADSGG